MTNELPQPLAPYTPDFELSEAQWLGLDGGDLFSTAMKNDSIFAQLTDKKEHLADKEDYLIDAKFDDRSKEQLWKEYNLDGSIHERYKKAFLRESRNKEHFDKLLPHYYNESAKLRFLESKGMGIQFGLGALAELTNAPLYIGAAAMMPATATVLGSTALTRFVASGTAGTILEGVKDHVGEHDKVAIDYAAALLMDGAMGAAFGKRTNQFAESIDGHLLALAGISKAGFERIKTLSPEAKLEAIKKAYMEKHQIEPSQSSLEAINASIQRASQYENTSFLQKTWESARQDLEYITKQSPSETLSSFGHKMFHDGTLQRLNPDEQDFATLRTLLEETMRGHRKTAFDPLLREFTDYKQKGGINYFKPDAQTEHEFSELLGKIQLSRNLNEETIDAAVARVSGGDKELHEILVKSAHKMEELIQKYHDMLGEHGNTDFSSGLIKKNPTHMPFVYNRDKIAALRSQGVTQTDMIDFFYEAFVKNNPTMPHDISKAIAHHFYNMVARTNTNSTGTFRSIIDQLIEDPKVGDDAKVYLRGLRDPRNVKPDEVKGVHGQRRTNIDYKHKKSVFIGDKKIDISFEKILDTNYTGVMDNYIRRMSGSTILRRYKFTPQAKPLSSSALTAKALMDPEVIALKEQVDAIGKIVTPEDITQLKVIADRILPSVDKRTKYGKELVEAINSENYEKAAQIIIDNIDAISKKMTTDDLNLFVSIGRRYQEFLTKSGALKSQYDDTLTAVKQRLKEESERPAERSLINASDYDELEDMIARELNDLVDEGKISMQDAKKELTRYKTIIKDMLGVPTAKDPHSGINRAYRIIHSYNIGRLLGQTFFTMPAEAMNVAYDSGLKNMMQQLPALKSLLKAYRSGKIDMKEIQEIQDFMGVYDEFLSGVRLYEFEHDYSALTRAKTIGSKFTDKLEAWGENFAEFTLMTGGIKPLTAWFQTAHIMGVFKKMKSIADTLDDTYKTSKITFPDKIIAKDGNPIVAKNIGKGKEIQISKDSKLWDEYMKNKNWTKPRQQSDGSYADALPDNAFKDIDDLKLFVTEHEIAHNKIVKKADETIGQYETRVNNEALRRIEARKKDTLYGDADYRKMINELGLSRKTEEEVYRAIKKHSKDGLMNFDKWDPDMRNIFLAGVKRRTDTLVQMQRLGDKPAWVSEADYMLKDTVAGKFAMELKQFVMTAYVKQLGRAVTRQDMYIAGLMASQALALSLSYITKQAWNYSGNEEKLKENLSPEKIVQGTLGMMPQGSVLPMLIDMGAGSILGEPIFGHTRHHSQLTNAINSLPAMDLANKVLGTIGIPQKMLGEDDLEVKDFRDPASLTGISNSWMTRPFYEAAKAD